MSWGDRYNDALAACDQENKKLRARVAELEEENGKLAQTAPEPAVPWWDQYPELQRVGFADAYMSWYLEGADITKFYRAAPLMAKVLLWYAENDFGEGREKARAALQAAGVEVPE